MNQLYSSRHFFRKDRALLIEHWRKLVVYEPLNIVSTSILEPNQSNLAGMTNQLDRRGSLLGDPVLLFYGELSYFVSTNDDTMFR